MAPVPDPEPGLGVAGAVDLGRAAVPSLPILVSFPIQHSADLASFLAGLSKPSAPTFHQYLTAAEFDREYGGSASDYAAALAFFQSFGVTHLQASADRLTLTFEASSDQIQQVFHVTIDSFRLAGQTYFAPTTSPQLPEPLATAIAGVEGLSTYSALFIHTDSWDALAHAPPPPYVALGSFKGNFLTPVTLGGVQYEYAPDFQVAYDEPSLFNDSGFPTNAVVATILWCGHNGSSTPVGPFVPADVYAFFNETLPTGEPHSHVYGVPLNGAPAAGPSASYDVTDANLENTLDLEMVGSTAPGASVYNVYGPSPTFANLDGAFSYILNPTGTPGLDQVSVITNSWGGGDRNDTVWYQDLEEAQARGISVLASSGDSGDNPSSTKNEGGPDLVEFPSAMAYNSFGDTAVGGTTVDLNPLSSSPEYLQLVRQTAWYISAADSADGGPAGSTGGISSVFAEPSWQLGTSANSVILGAGRAAPDIAAIANNTLLTVTINGVQYRASNATYGGSFDHVWGTSIASPLEAGVVAEMDHVLGAHGNGPLGFLNPLAYSLGNYEYAPLVSSGIYGFFQTGSYASGLPTLPLLDVTTGANAVYAAKFGFDLVTGWGSIDAYNYTMYVLTTSSNGVYGRLSGVEDSFTLNNLAVTSYYLNHTVNTQYNASIQQNFFLANGLGAPVYWIQNVIYITKTAGGWYMTDSGWVVFPFYGQYPTETIYEYAFPTGQYVSFPSTFDVKTVLQTSGGFDKQNVTFYVSPNVGANSPTTLVLPVPGAAYIIGSLGYHYSWQGVNYSNGPYPNNPTPGGLAPQFGLVGGPSGAIGIFRSPTSGQLSMKLEPFGTSSFVAATTETFGESIDQTGEVAANLSWTAGSGGSWTLGISLGSTVQGVLAYETSQSSVNFSEAGLPTGTSWSVTLAGVLVASTTNTISFEAANGVSSYIITDVPGWHQTTLSYSGTVTVSGGSVVEPTLMFSRVTYGVSFTQSGLPFGTAWGITLGGSLGSSTNYTLGFVEPNGSYSFSIKDVPGWHQSALSYSGGSLTVNGAPVAKTMVFTQFTYTVTFEESGLPNGTAWSVTLAGVTQSSSGLALVFNEPNGTFTFTVVAVNGFSNSPSSGSLQVSGSGASQSVTFTANPTFLGLPADEGYALLGGILAAVVIGAVVAVILVKRGARARAVPPGVAAGVRYCPTCGTANATDDAFCMRCGNRLPPPP